MVLPIGLGAFLKIFEKWSIVKMISRRHFLTGQKASVMGNLKIQLAAIATCLIAVAMAFGFFGPDLAKSAMGDALPWWQLALGAFVFAGLCSVVVYSILERALNPVMHLTDHFVRMRLGDLDPRLPVEGPEEMQRLARAFNETMGELELQIRTAEEEKQATERGRQFLIEQLEASNRFKALAESLPFGLVLADANLTVVYQNGISRSGFLQLADFLAWNADEVVGHSLVRLFPDQRAAHEIISAPDRLPYETTYDIGPYQIRFITGPVWSEDEEYLGPVLLWEVLGLESLKADTALPDLDERALDEMVEAAEQVEIATSSFGDTPTNAVSNDVESPEYEHRLARQLMAAENQLKRGTALVGRSIRLLSERLSTVTSMVEALCNEGDNLHRSLEETRQRTQNATYLTTERSESLWELVQEMGGMEERTRATTMLVKRLKKTLDSTETITQSIGKLSDVVEHMVLEARLEAGRAGDAGDGMMVIVEEIRKIGRETTRVNKDVKKRMDDLKGEVEDALALLEEDRREVRSGGRIARRAENALERIERDLSDVEERTNLLAEMTAGQSEIGAHIAAQLSELTELINVTQRVAGEQARTVEKLLREADSRASAVGVEK